MLTSSPVISSGGGGGGGITSAVYNTQLGAISISGGVASFPAHVFFQRQGSQTAAVASGTTGIPFDNTIPLVTEGTTFIGPIFITPFFGDGSTNVVVIVDAFFSRVATSTTNKHVVGALFAATDGTLNYGANAVATCIGYSPYLVGDTGMVALHLEYDFSPASTNRHAFIFRAGVEGSGTVDALRFNSSDGTNALFGGTLASGLWASEYEAFNYPPS